MSYYRVLLDGIDIYDPAQLLLTFSSPHAVCGLSDAGSFDFVMPKGHIFYDNVVPYGSTIEVFEDGQSIFYGRPTLPKTDFYGNKQIHCEGALAFLNDVIVPPIKVSGGEKITMKEYITILFDYYNNTCRREDRKLVLGSVNLQSDQEAKHVWNYETCFDILRQGILPYTGSYTITRRALGVTYIDFVYRFNTSINQPIKLASNLLDMTKTGQEFYTAVMAKGASDAVQMLSPMLADNALIQKYGFICAYKEYPNCETLTELQMQCSVFLKSQQFSGMRFEASATDLHLENSAYQQFVVGAVTQIDSPFHDFANNFRATISKIEINLDTGEKNATLLTLTQQILTIVDTEDYQYQFSVYDPDYEYTFPDDYDYFFKIVDVDDLEWTPKIWVQDPLDPSKYEEKDWQEGEDPPIGEDVEEVLIKHPAEDLDDIEEGTKIITPIDPENPNNLDDIIGEQPEPISAIDNIINNTPQSETPELPGNYSDYTPIKGEDGNSYVVQIDENGEVEATKIPDNLVLTDGVDPITSITMDIGDTFDPSDITPRLQYGDGTTVPAENVQYNIPDGYEFTGSDDDPDWLTALITDPNIKITYTQTIEIKKESQPDIVSIFFSQVGGPFNIGDAFDVSNFRVLARRADGSTIDITSQCIFSLLNGSIIKQGQLGNLTALFKIGDKWFSTNTNFGIYPAYQDEGDIALSSLADDFGVFENLLDKLEIGCSDEVKELLSGYMSSGKLVNTIISDPPVISGDFILMYVSGKTYSSGDTISLGKGNGCLLYRFTGMRSQGGIYITSVQDPVPAIHGFFTGSKETGDGNIYLSNINI